MSEATIDPRAISGEVPVESELARTGAPQTVAGGLESIVVATSHALHKMGPVRTLQTLTRVNQMGGFDCPSCAWPEDDRHRDAAAFCENGAKAVADEAMTARVDAAFFEAHSLEDLRGRTDHWLNLQGRLTEPMIAREGASHYTPISWDEAFATIARALNALSTPDEANFYTSGRTSNEAAFLYQLFVREFGTNNLPDCSNMCHESSGVALSGTIGIGKGTVTLEDFDHAEVIVVIGQNPGTNHPRMLTALQSAKRHGARIVAINPLHEAGLLRFKHPQLPSDLLIGRGTELADLLLPVAVNGDLATMRGIAKALLALDRQLPGSVVDRAFVAGKTAGSEAFIDAVEATSWDDIEAGAGLTRAEIESAAAMLAGVDKIIFTWAMGVTQSPNAVETIEEIVNVALLKGSIGKAGAGLCPVRGHSNVQGDRTMGINERPSAEFLDALDREVGLVSPRNEGFDVVESIKAMHDGRAKVFVALGGNFLSAAPDTRHTAEALRSQLLTVQVSTKLNRSHLVGGKVAIILPCLGRTELDVQESGPQLVTCENSMGVVQTSEGRLAPASASLLSEPKIVAKLARATLGEKSRVDWESLVANYDRTRDLIERIIPGFEQFNRRVRRPGGFYLPNGPRVGTFTTPSGKAQFTVHTLPKRALRPGELVMMTVRTHDQFNTTVYGLDDRYRGIRGGRRVVLMNEADIAERGLTAGDRVDITSHFRGVERRVDAFQVVPYAIPKGDVATYFPEANPLVPIDSVAARSGTPSSKYVVVTLRKSP
ncbi:MAG: FdhF/YdeP family oxidoreductase [Polyangiales bacterium]